MKKQNIIIIIVFGALIFGLGLLGWLTPDQAFSENENRYLQELPKLSEDTMVNGDFGDEVEDYLSDQFWQRDSWTAARSKMKMLLRNKDIGAFDVSILDISSGVIEVLATAGNNHLGGITTKR